VVRLGARDVGDPGYDRATGFGVLSLPGALAYAAPPDDPQEPNDDIRYVNGRAFEMPSPALYGGRNSTRSLTATVDVAEDPVDVYRVRVRAGRSLRMTLRPSVGDPDLFMYGPRAKSVRRSRRLAGSTRTGLRADRLTIRNHDDRTRTYYVAVAFSVRKARTMLNARYELRAG
jgi:hypothetical protein